ncbi:hypothetical protein LOTGIDRAFT_226064 [Lottia gigantea]|uniref:Protein-glucosylgalactosylhydroxylysine glucosidase n=1 Tax=Lottia gigantea TaxID=225164 RepID=V4CDW2_LOTGI|nr:hypothetical protein LOTGIDRAFT_226064 [Lottia gigantea]ESP00135.1 hypothetical protein LOTGIDRAFT_226064 [Lottia gigantea]
MNGLYNGTSIKSHRARIPAYINIGIDSIEQSTPFVYLFVLPGMFQEILLYDKVRVEIQTYCHREYSRVLVVSVEVERMGSSKEDLTVKLKTSPGLISEDIRFKLIKCVDRVCSKTGETMEAEYPDSKPTIPVSIVYDEISDIVLTSNIHVLTVYYFMSCGVSIGETNRSYDRAIKAFEAGTLVEDHVKAWEELWNNGRIDVEGNRNLSTSIYSSLYYLLSSVPSHPDQYNWPFMGMSPTGLAHGVDEDVDYAGHVFWDQDTWMFPSIMLLHSTIGKILVQSRLDKLTTARLLAKYRGLPGAVFPWESAYTGLPTSNCPNCSRYEIHISADVSLALRQYLFLTNDSDFLEHGGTDTLMDLATFWAARVTLNPDTKLYEIHEVMGPDEWHFPVNNSAYTNTAARLAIETGVTAMIRRGQSPPSHWTDIINNMYIPLDNQYQYHPEYDRYSRGTNVKQADVILLGYPLMDKTLTKDVQENDLNYYAQVTPRGPAMTWSMFAINFLEVGNSTLAEKYFIKQSDNILPPFNVWTENADGSGAVNFHTGMGGYLQSILFGYGGIRVLEDRLNFDPQLMSSVASWNITGLDYGGNSFDMKFDRENMFITLTKSQHPVAVYLYHTQAQEQCFPHKTLSYPRQKAAFKLLPVIEIV